MNWKNWLRGLIAAAINGGATAITTMVVSPSEFNLEDGLSKVLAVAAISAILGVATYLKQSPLPD